MASPSAYDALRGLLFSQPSERFDVSPRRRLVGSNLGTAFAANESIVLGTTIPLPDAPLLSGMAWLFELIAVAFGLGASNNPFTIPGLSAAIIDNNGDVIMPLGQGSVTTQGGQSTAIVSSVIQAPIMVTEEDLSAYFSIIGANGAITSMSVAAVVENGATAQTIDMRTWLGVRVVRGLQEG